MNEPKLWNPQGKVPKPPVSRLRQEQLRALQLRKKPNQIEDYFSAGDNPSILHRHHALQAEQASSR